LYRINVHPTCDDKLFKIDDAALRIIFDTKQNL